ncbi:MAG: hypothetical protein HYX56_05995, partial [Chloroflexi bacterium]|nr:hypothetical protein [Chloroflexota bacterium]
IWTERPELFGAVLFAALVLLLQVPGERPLFAIAPLLILWANVHGSFALGSGLVALIAIHGLATDQPLRRGYLVALAGALLSLVLTPAGLGTLTTPGIHLFDPPREIQEWAIPDPRTPAGALWAFLLAATIATAALSPFPARAREVLLIVPVALLSLIAIRHAPLFAIAATPYLAARLPEVAMAIARAATGDGASPAVAYATAAGSKRTTLKEVVDKARPSGGAGATAERRQDPRPLAFAAISGALLIGGIVIAPREPNATTFPVAALASLPQDGLLNEYDWGGWLIWRGVPVFIDGRLVPYRDRVLRDYETVVGAKPGWRDVIARDGVRWLLLRPSQPAAVRAQQLGWRVVSRSAYHVLIQVPGATP